MNTKVLALLITVLACIAIVAWLLGSHISVSSIDSSVSESKNDVVVPQGITSPLETSVVTVSKRKKRDINAHIVEADSDGILPKSTPEQLEQAIRVVDEFTRNTASKSRRSGVISSKPPIKGTPNEDTDFEFEKTSESDLHESIQQVLDISERLNAEARLSGS